MLSKREELFEKIKEIISGILEINEDMIAPAARLRDDLGMDSLDAYEIAYALDAECNINCPDDMLMFITTVQDFIDWLDGQTAPDKTKSTIAEWRKRGEEEDIDVPEVWKCGKCGCLYPMDVPRCYNCAVDETPVPQDKGKFHSIYASHEAMLLEKNKRYGDSALKPVKVFASHLDDVDSILIRLDDKISRIRNSDEIRKNDVSDLMGYCILLCKAKGWTDFMDQVD